MVNVPILLRNFGHVQAMSECGLRKRLENFVFLLYEAHISTYKLVISSWMVTIRICISGSFENTFDFYEINKMFEENIRTFSYVPM